MEKKIIITEEEIKLIAKSVLRKILDRRKEKLEHDSELIQLCQHSIRQFFIEILKENGGKMEIYSDHGKPIEYNGYPIAIMRLNRNTIITSDGHAEYCYHGRPLMNSDKILMHILNEMSPRCKRKLGIPENICSAL